MYKCSECSSQFYFKSHLKDHEDFKHPNRAAEPVRTSSEYGTPLGTNTAARDRLRGIWNASEYTTHWARLVAVAPETRVTYQPDLFTQYWIDDAPIVGCNNTVA